MKKIFVLGFFVLGIIKLVAQDFAPIGAEWYYTEHFAFSKKIDYYKFTSIKDSVFEGKNCRMIQKNDIPSCSGRPLIEFMYQEDSAVYFYDKTFNRFQVLYDLKKKVNESWHIEVIDSWYNNKLDTIKITVDSISSIIINDKPLKKMNVTYHRIADKFSYPSIIIEKFGDIHYLFNYLPSSILMCDGTYSGGLRCYQDSEFGFHSLGISESCDYTFEWTNIQEIESNTEILIIPNPTKSIINIYKTAKEVFTSELTDFSGKIISTFKLDSDVQIDLSGFQNGIYLLVIKNEDKIITIRKVVKN